MKYFKYYVFGYYGETLGTVCGYDNFADALDHVRFQKKHCAYTSIEICQIRNIEKETIEQYNRRK